MKKGFTLLELIIVIVIIGILSTLGYTQYGKAVENGRQAEAKTKLGFFRKVEIGYKMENGSYAIDLSTFDSTCGSCNSNSYFFYLYGISAGICGSAGESLVTAYRCTSGGKTPNGSSQYSVSLCIESGTWGYYNP